MRRVRYIRDAVFILVATLVLLCLCEFGVRVAFPDRARAHPFIRPIAYEYDPTYGVTLRPNFQGQYTRSLLNGGQTIHWSTTADRFRTPASLSNQRPRIVVYGDSNIQAVFSDDEHTFAKQLEKYLKHSRFPQCETINAGVVGFGIDQCYLRFQKEADWLKPDIVIFNLFVDNDFGDLFRNRLLELDERGQLISTPFGITRDTLLDEHSHYLNMIENSSLLIQGMRNLIETHGGRSNPKPSFGPTDAAFKYEADCQREYEVYRNRRPREFSHFYDHYDIDLAISPTGESAREKIRLMESVLKASNQFARSRNIKFLVVIEPSRVDCALVNGVLNHNYLQRYPSYKRSGLTDSAQSACQAAHVMFVNLFAPFIQNDPDTLYFQDDDNHWNDRGQQLAAQQTAQFIVDHHL